MKEVILCGNIQQIVSQGYSKVIEVDETSKGDKSFKT